MCRKYGKKYPCMPTIAATIQQNMYKYANTRKTSRLGNVSGMPKRKRMWSTHGDAWGNCVYGCKNLKSVYTHKKRGIGKNRMNVWKWKRKKKTQKINTERNDTEKKKTADGDDADERDGNGYVGWRSIRSAGNCDARRTSERRYGEHRARQEADARLQWWSANGTTAYAWSTLSFFS